MLAASFTARAAFAGTPAANVESLIASVRGGNGSYKVRVHAAVLLASTEDSRAISALAYAATHDPEVTMRVVALQMLARNPGGEPNGATARVAIAQRFSDGVPRVRQAAQQALQALKARLRDRAALSAPSVAANQRAPAGGPLKIAIGRVGGDAPVPLRERMRTEVAGNLRNVSRVQVCDLNAVGVNFVVDGTIKRATLAKTAREVEAVCAVDLLLSQPPRGILLVASGEAVVQKSPHYFRGTMRQLMVEEALTHAVRSAHENLREYLTRQI